MAFNPKDPEALRQRIALLARQITASAKRTARLKRWRKTRVRQLQTLGITRVWYSAARKLPRDDAGTWVSGNPKGVLHTTEGSGDATATLDANRAWPHFQVEQGGRVTQYLPINRAGRALEHRPGTVDTNRAHAIQIEVCGFAAKTDWPEAQVIALRKLMRWIESNAGVARLSTVKFVPVGETNHFSSAAWLAYNGWCGHQHVPNNSHTDPGAIDVKALLR